LKSYSVDKLFKKIVFYEPRSFITVWNFRFSRRIKMRAFWNIAPCSQSRWSRPKQTPTARHWAQFRKQFTSVHCLFWMTDRLNNKQTNYKAQRPSWEANSSSTAQ
jgi:hypothetical protein